MRYLQLDGLRGIMLISMAMSHLGTTLPLGPTHGLVFKTALINDAASVFIFLSGLTIGLVYTRGWTDPVYQYRRKALSERTFVVFRHHVILVALVTIFAALALHGDRQVWILDRFGDAPMLFGLLSLMMLAGGFCLDILPLYVLFLLLTPAALSAATSNRRWLVIGAVIVAWLIGQAGLLELGWDTLEILFHLDQWHIDLGLHLNRLSWSALYFSGLLFGAAHVRGELDLAILKQSWVTPIVLACLVVLASLMLVLVLYLNATLTDHLPFFAWLVSKHGLGFLFLLNFLASALVVTWLLVAAPTSPYSTMRVLGRQLSRLLESKPLVLLGQHSLAVFSFHVALVYAVHLTVDANALEPWSANALLLLGVLSLFIPAFIGRHAKQQKRRAMAAETVSHAP